MIILLQLSLVAGSKLLWKATTVKIAGYFEFEYGWFTLAMESEVESE